MNLGLTVYQIAWGSQTKQWGEDRISGLSGTPEHSTEGLPTSVSVNPLLMNQYDSQILSPVKRDFRGYEMGMMPTPFACKYL
jgi:hypothetical protein